jgi:subtilisin family serine protease
MNKKIIILLTLTLLILSNIYSQISVSLNHYCVYFTDKKDSPYSINNPLEFLSQKAIDRREKYNIAITEQDIPVNPQYIQKLKDDGYEIVNVSKWLNCAIVYTRETKKVNNLSTYPFVIQETEKNLSSKKGTKSVKTKTPKLKSLALEEIDTIDYYGKASNQIKMLNGHVLHSRGFQGQGMVMAILDAGFYHVNSLPSFDSLWANNQILGWYDFVDGDTSLFNADNHGMQVLSTIAANMPDEFVGTAPKASFWLLRTEQSASEYVIEEYNWVCGAEFADSVGVDIIHSSLGYNDFDDSTQDYSYEDMNGNTAICTIGADIAASKGILVITSAGNEGNDPWKYISAPADGDSVLAIGAVNSKGKYAYFSSQGPTYDGRIKPDVCAQGMFSTVQGAGGSISSSNGTSFSGPILAGMVACLWQANPSKTNMEIIDAVQKSASQYSEPDEKLGYGIPDFNFAYLYLKEYGFINLNDEKPLLFFPNPFNDDLNVEIFSSIENLPSSFEIKVYDILGKHIFTKNVDEKNNTYNAINLNELAYLQAGTYIVQVNSNFESYNQLIIKN